MSLSDDDITTSGGTGAVMGGDADQGDTDDTQVDPSGSDPAGSDPSS